MTPAAERQWRTIDSPISVRGKKLICGGTQVGTLEYRRDSCRFLGKKRRLFVSKTVVILEDATYEIAVALSARPSRAVAEPRPDRPDGPSLPVRWSLDARGEAVLEPDPAIWDYDATRPGHPPSPTDLIDHALVEVTASGRPLLDEWTNVGVEIRDETRMRVRVDILPDGPLPLAFAVRRWHLTKALLYFDLSEERPRFLPFG